MLRCWRRASASLALGRRTIISRVPQAYAGVSKALVHSPALVERGLKPVRSTGHGQLENFYRRLRQRQQTCALLYDALAGLNAKQRRRFDSAVPKAHVGGQLDNRRRVGPVVGDTIRLLLLNKQVDDARELAAAFLSSRKKDLPPAVAGGSGLSDLLPEAASTDADAKRRTFAVNAAGNAYVYGSGLGMLQPRAKLLWMQCLILALLPAGPEMKVDADELARVSTTISEMSVALARKGPVDVAASYIIQVDALLDSAPEQWSDKEVTAMIQDFVSRQSSTSPPSSRVALALFKHRIRVAKTSSECEFLRVELEKHDKDGRLPSERAGAKYLLVCLSLRQLKVMKEDTALRHSRREVERMFELYAQQVTLCEHVGHKRDVRLHRQLREYRQATLILVLHLIFNDDFARRFGAFAAHRNIVGALEKTLSIVGLKKGVEMSSQARHVAKEASRALEKDRALARGQHWGLAKQDAYEAEEVDSLIFQQAFIEGPESLEQHTDEMLYLHPRYWARFFHQLCQPSSDLPIASWPFLRKAVSTYTAVAAFNNSHRSSPLGRRTNAFHRRFLMMRLARAYLVAPCTTPTGPLGRIEALLEDMDRLDKVMRLKRADVLLAVQETLVPLFPGEVWADEVQAAFRKVDEWVALDVAPIGLPEQEEGVEHRFAPRVLETETTAPI